MWSWRGSLGIASVPRATCLPIRPWTRPTQASVSRPGTAWALACWISARVNKVGSAPSIRSVRGKTRRKFHGVREWQAVLDLILTESFVRSGAPIIMSSPHFYQADEKLVQDVFGMRPTKEEHQTTIDINPVGISTSIPRWRNALHPKVKIRSLSTSAEVSGLCVTTWCQYDSLLRVKTLFTSRWWTISAFNQWGWASFFFSFQTVVKNYSIGAWNGHQR